MADHRPFDGYVRPRWLDTPDWTYIIPTDHPTIKERDMTKDLLEKEVRDRLHIEQIANAIKQEQQTPKKSK